VNGKIAPKSNVVGAADPVSQWGRRNSRKRKGKCLGGLPGFVPSACRRRISCEQGRSTRLKRSLKGLTSQRGEEDPMAWWKSDWLIVL
jgi:hypothetical protein